MTVIDRRGQPLPENHPLKGNLIIFGGRKPVPPPQGKTNLDKVAHDKRMASQTPAQRDGQGLGSAGTVEAGRPRGEPNAKPT